MVAQDTNAAVIMYSTLSYATLVSLALVWLHDIHMHYQTWMWSVCWCVAVETLCLGKWYVEYTLYDP